MSRRILVVEDEEDNLTLLLHILAFLLKQDNLIVARDGREAMRLAEQESPELIIMDLSLPALDGWEATRSLKADPRFADIPIVALTAHAMVGDKQKALEAGCDDYYPKPIDIGAFLDFIQPYLGEPDADRLAAAEEPPAERPAPAIRLVPHPAPDAAKADADADYTTTIL